MQRQFTSGSRQAPDPFDQYLEEHNFYRKYTARDSSCLFRVISEQMYDTQQYHLSIRKKCVGYMRKHRDYFEPLINRDFEEYLDDLSKPKTYGTHLELQAAGFMFERNVLLFEGFTLGNLYVSNPFFTGIFRVFYTSERHFDSVYPGDYIKDVAICQSICYEILYKDVYKLPDVIFAVEQMLHADTLDEATHYRTEYNADGYCTRIHLADGRLFDFDLPNNTNCILEDYKFCHFHYNNFLNEWRNAPTNAQRGTGERTPSEMNWAIESVLPHKHFSCVRQLLKEGITPFPYKVAKALDPNMYRNIEFDAWNEMRKENFQNWYNGDANFKVGAKCHVKLRKSENDLYTCHIQEIAMDKGSCLVFIEQLGEKHLVPYESLTPLPQDQFQPWSLPYSFQRHMQKYSALRLTRHYNCHFKLNRFCNGAKQSGAMEMLTDVGKQHHNNCYYKLKQYTQLENFQTNMFEYCTMPLTVEHSPRELEPKLSRSESTSVVYSISDGGDPTPTQTKPEIANGNRLPDTVVAGTPGQPDQLNIEGDETDGLTWDGVRGVYMPELHYLYPLHPYTGPPDDYNGYVYDGNMPPSTPALIPPGTVNGGTIYYMCNPNFSGYPATGNNLFAMQPSQPLQVAPHTLITPIPTLQGPMQACPPYYSNSCFGGSGVTSGTPCSGVPPGSYNGSPSSVGILRQRSNHKSGNVGDSAASPSAMRRVNFDVKKSVKPNGMDLPYDVATLRYFFNLGWDYYHKLQPAHDEQANKAEPKIATDVQKIECSTSEDVKPDHNKNIDSVPNFNSNCGSANSQNTSKDSKTVTTPNANYTSQNQLTSQMNPSNKPSNHSYNNHQSQRRPMPRYFGKDRQRGVMNMGNSNNGAGNANGTQSFRYQKDFMVKGGSKSGNSSSTPNSSRSQMSASSEANSGGNSGYNVLVGNEHNYQNAVSTGYEGGAPMQNNALQQTSPHVYNGALHNMLSYGPCEFGADNPTGGNMYIPMPLAPPPPFGLYAGAPPPQTLGMISTMGGVYPTYPCPPPPQPPVAPTSGGPYIQAPNAAAAAHTMPPPLHGNGNGFYMAPPGTSCEVAENGGDVIHLPYVRYPPMQLPYVPTPTVAVTATTTTSSTNGGVTPTNVNGPSISVAAATAPQGCAPLGNTQGYWCLQTNAMQPTQTQPPASVPAQAPSNTMHANNTSSPRNGTNTAAGSANSAARK